MNKRRWMVLAGIVFVAIVAGIGIKSIFEARASKERQTLYTAALKDYSDALVPGTSRREVEATCGSVIILIGRCAASPITEAHMPIW